MEADGVVSEERASIDSLTEDLEAARQGYEIRGAVIGRLRTTLKWAAIGAFLLAVCAYGWSEE